MRRPRTDWLTFEPQIIEAYTAADASGGPLHPTLKGAAEHLGISPTLLNYHIGRVVGEGRLVRRPQPCTPERFKAWKPEYLDPSQALPREQRQYHHMEAGKLVDPRLRVEHYNKALALLRERLGDPDLELDQDAYQGYNVEDILVLYLYSRGYRPVAIFKLFRERFTQSNHVAARATRLIIRGRLAPAHHRRGRPAAEPETPPPPPPPPVSPAPEAPRMRTETLLERAQRSRTITPLSYNHRCCQWPLDMGMPTDAAEINRRYPDPEKRPSMVFCEAVIDRRLRLPSGRLLKNYCEHHHALAYARSTRKVVNTDPRPEQVAA